MRYVFQPQMVGKDPETFEAGVREQVFEVCVRDGHLTTREGVLAAPATVITTDIEALHSMLMEGLQAADALAAGWAAVKGDEGALGCFLGMFRFPRSLASVTGLAWSWAALDEKEQGRPSGRTSADGQGCCSPLKALTKLASRRRPASGPQATSEPACRLPSGFAGQWCSTSTCRNPPDSLMWRNHDLQSGTVSMRSAACSASRRLAQTTTSRKLPSSSLVT